MKNLTKSTIFRLFLLFFIIGIGFSSFFNVEFFVVFIIILFSLVGTVLFWNNQKWRWIFLAGVFIALGILRYQVSLPQTDETKIWFYNGQRVSFEGIVTKESDV